jgi:hypothetical protein
LVRIPAVHTAYFNIPVRHVAYSGMLS